MAERAMLAALSGLMRGLNEGLETRRNREIEDKKLLMAEEEMELKSLDRIESRKMRATLADQNAAYREASLTQTTANNRSRNQIDMAKLNQTEDRNTEALQLKANEGLAKLLEKKNELEDDLSDIERMASRNPTKYGTQYDRMKTQLAEMGTAIQTQRDVLQGLQESGKPTARPATRKPVQTVGDVTSFVDQINNAPDETRAKKALENAKAKGYLKRGTPSFEALMDAYTRRF